MTTTLDLDRSGPAVAEPDLHRAVAQALRRWPSAGLAVAVVRAGSPPLFLGHGVADVPSGRPAGERTVFRVGSLTKVLTAVAVMQLCEQGLVDLDAPAADRLRAFRLVPADAGFRPATVAHLLTHTAGVGYWRRRSDLLLHPGVGSGNLARSIVPMAEFYRGGLPVDVEPGTRWAYSNHGFAALGQIVEDVSGEPLDRYLRAHVFGPLGMEDTDLVLSERLRAQLATGYTLRRGRLAAVRYREVPTPGSGGVHSTARDMSRFVAAMLHGGAGEHGRVLTAESVASMFHAHFRPDPRVAGMGLGFDRHEERGRTFIGKTGIVSGFLSAIGMAPDEGVGVVVLGNTGGLDARGAPAPLADALVRLLVGLPEDPVRDDVAPSPEVWPALCGWYAADAGPNTNLFTRLAMGAGIEVGVRHRELVLTPLTPVPGMRAGMVLHPDDPSDPRVFHVAHPQYGWNMRVVFTEGSPPRLFYDLMSFEKRPARENPRRWAMGTAAAAVAATAAVRRSRAPSTGGRSGPVRSSRR
ncbi:serine hydrolase domain-containing protein [Geodermatophilus sp. SYSU D00691]